MLGSAQSSQEASRVRGASTARPAGVSVLLGGVALVGLVGAGTAPAALTLPVRLAAQQAPAASVLWTSDDSGSADGSGGSSGSASSGCTDGSCGASRGTTSASGSSGASPVSASGGSTAPGSTAPAGPAPTGPAPSGPADPGQTNPVQSPPVQTPPVQTPPVGGSDGSPGSSPVVGGGNPSTGGTPSGTGGNPSTGGNPGSSGGNPSTGGRQAAASDSPSAFASLLTWIQNLFSGNTNTAPAPASNSGGQNRAVSVDAGSSPAVDDKNGSVQAAPVAAVPGVINGNKFTNQRADANDPASQMIRGVLISVSRVIGTVVPASGQS
jgi:hypothetical protein